jgi:hypothetical protein
MEANREGRDQARRESELFHKLKLTPPIKHHKSLFVARFCAPGSVQPSALNFELSAATEKQWHADFGAYGIRTRDLLNAIEALYQLS